MLSLTAGSQLSKDTSIIFVKPDTIPSGYTDSNFALTWDWLNNVNFDMEAQDGAIQSLLGTGTVSNPQAGSILANSVASIIIAVFAPSLGAIADNSSFNENSFAVNSYSCSSFKISVQS